MNDKALSDRRRSPRYTVKDSVFVFPRPHFAVVGRLQDLSRGGACFVYGVFGEGDGDLSDTREIDILLQGRFYLSHVPCEVVYDIGVEHPTLLGIGTRRCGVKFGDLSHHQIESIQSVLKGAIKLPQRTLN
jgi:hypothetical protein